MYQSLLSIEIGKKYSYEYLIQFFGGEKFNGIETPELHFELGEKVINLVFESDRIITGKNEYVPVSEVDGGYTLVSIESYDKKEFK